MADQVGRRPPQSRSKFLLPPAPPRQKEMKVQLSSGLPSPALARALAEFEAPFTYPLGPGKFFRISHGEDYTLFFRALGDAACFIAEDQGRVLAVLGTAIRPLRLPNGSECAAGYLGDLKIAVHIRGGSTLVRLARAAEAWLRPKVHGAFGVVMDGTKPTPDAYTGRAGIPAFRDLGRVMVFRLSASDEPRKDDLAQYHTTQEAGFACYRRLSLGRYACGLADAQKRSVMTPLWLMTPDGSACGMLEDTRKAKRLINRDGSELLTAHLSYFACNTVRAGAELIDIARAQLKTLGFPALFVAVADVDAQGLRQLLPAGETTAAPATVYGAGLAPGTWNINSSEI